MNVNHRIVLLLMFSATVGLSSANAQDKPAAAARPQVKHVIDTHIHLYDPNRPDGIPWPPPDDEVLYKPHLPSEYTKLAST